MKFVYKDLSARTRERYLAYNEKVRWNAALLNILDYVKRNYGSAHVGSHCEGTGALKGIKEEVSIRTL